MRQPVYWRQPACRRQRRRQVMCILLMPAWHCGGDGAGLSLLHECQAKLSTSSRPRVLVRRQARQLEGQTPIKMNSSATYLIVGKQMQASIAKHDAAGQALVRASFRS